MVRVGGAPRRAAAKRCAYHTEQKSLERTFESIDPATIAEVLASHSGNMDLAAMDLVELDRVGFKGTSGDSSPDDKKPSGGAPGEDPSEKAKAVDGSFWNDVLGDVTMEDDEEAVVLCTLLKWEMATVCVGRVLEQAPSGLQFDSARFRPVCACCSPLGFTTLSK